MRTQYIVLAAAVVAAFVLMSWLRSRSTRSQPEAAPQKLSLAELSEGEQKVERLIREVYGDAILSETFLRVGGSVKVEVDLDTNKTTHVTGANTTSIKNLTINLSSLARQQKEDGASDAALKASLRF